MFMLTFLELGRLVNFWNAKVLNFDTASYYFEHKFDCLIKED